MSRINRLRRALPGKKQLTAGQETLLLAGLALGGEGFETPEAMERAWWAHREQLMEECGALQRPHAFWLFEAKDGEHVAGRERDEDRLLRLRLALSPHELAILTPAPPLWIPDVIPPGALEYWGRAACSMDTRRAWHEREGRPEQAAAWREQRELLLRRIAATMRQSSQ